MREIGDPGWQFFVRDDCFVMAGECPDALPPEQLGDHSYFAYLVVDGIDQLYAELTAKGVTLAVAGLYPPIAPCASTYSE